MPTGYITRQIIMAATQNMPNPFNKTTTIKYILLQKFANAQIVISDQNGKDI